MVKGQAPGPRSGNLKVLGFELTNFQAGDQHLNHFTINARTRIYPTWGANNFSHLMSHQLTYQDEKATREPIWDIISL